MLEGRLLEWLTLLVTLLGLLMGGPTPQPTSHPEHGCCVRVHRCNC